MKNIWDKYNGRKILKFLLVKTKVHNEDIIIVQDWRLNKKHKYVWNTALRYKKNGRISNKNF